MLKKHYELRQYVRPVTGPKLYVWYGDDVLPKTIVPFGSMEEAELRLSAMGLEKGERTDVSYDGTVIKRFSRWEVRPCS